MSGKKLVPKNPNDDWEIRREAGSIVWWVYWKDQHAVPANLVRENNRGWTFETFCIGSSRVEFFYSRGEYDLILQEGDEEE